MHGHVAAIPRARNISANELAQQIEQLVQKFIAEGRAAAAAAV